MLITNLHFMPKVSDTRKKKKFSTSIMQAKHIKIQHQKSYVTNSTVVSLEASTFQCSTTLFGRMRELNQYVQKRAGCPQKAARIIQKTGSVPVSS